MSLSSELPLSLAPSCFELSSELNSLLPKVSFRRRPLRPRGLLSSLASRTVALSHCGTVVTAVRRPQQATTLQIGAGLGMFCAGCCWGLMALGFAGGTMSLAWMGLATLVMVLEKLPKFGHYVIRPMGVVLSVAGLLVTAFSATGI